MGEVSDEGQERVVGQESRPRRRGIGRCLCDNRGIADRVRYRAAVRCSYAAGGISNGHGQESSSLGYMPAHHDSMRA